MAAKIALLFVSALVIFQVLTWGTDATIIRRDAPPPEKNASQAIDEALQSFKNSFDDIVKNIQSNDLYQNVSQHLKTFGEHVQNQGKQIVEKIQGATKTE